MASPPVSKPPLLGTRRGNAREFSKQAQTPASEVCGSSSDSRFRIQGLPAPAGVRTAWGGPQEKKDVAQGSRFSLAALPPRRALGGAALENSDYLVCGAARARTAGKAAGPESGPCATTRVQISFPSTPMSKGPFAVGGRLAVPSVYIAAKPGWVGQALPLLGDRVAQIGKLQAQRLQFERRLRSCDPEVAAVNSPLELTVGSSSKEKPTVTRALTVACIYPQTTEIPRRRIAFRGCRVYVIGQSRFENGNPSQNPAMPRQVPAAFVGNSGEFFVLAELTRRGWTAAPTARNNRAYDILAKRGDDFAGIRVKTKAWPFALFQWNAKPSGDIFLDVKVERDFCVLVDIPKDGDAGPIYYVVPTSVIDRWLRDDFRTWVTTPGAKGQQRAENNKRRIFYVDDDTSKVGHGYRQRLAPYLGAWSLLGSTLVGG